MIRDLAQRLGAPALFLLVTVVVGTGGYWVIGGGQWSLFDCFYMVMITVTTVGFTEVLELQEQTGARLFTVALILMGMGAVLTVASQLTAFIVEGELRHAWIRRKREKMLSQLDKHAIICGIGRTGRHVVDELCKSQRDFVAIDEDSAAEEIVHQALAAAKGRSRAVFIHGDATSEAELRHAGIERATALAAVLPDDKDNLFLTMTAKLLNPPVRIVAKAMDPANSEKLARAGAVSIISPNQLGGLRIATELVQPMVVGFLERTIGQGEAPMHIEELTLSDSSEWRASSVEEVGLRNDPAALLLAVRRSDGEFFYHPPKDYRFSHGETLILLSTRERAAELRKRV